MVLTPKYHSGPDLSERQPNVQLVLGNKEAAVPVKEPKCAWPSKSFGKIKFFCQMFEGAKDSDLGNQPIYLCPAPPFTFIHVSQGRVRCAAQWREWGTGLRLFIVECFLVQ